MVISKNSNFDKKIMSLRGKVTYSVPWQSFKIEFLEVKL